MRKKTTNIILILDKSGSMDSAREAVISSLNEYLGTLRKDDNRYNLTVAAFNTELDYMVKDEDLDDVERFHKSDYKPDGMTALYDSVCKVLKKYRDNEGKNLCVIMTDGYENASMDYDEKDMQKLVKKLEKTDLWSFVYMGANQDSYAVARDWVPQANISNFNVTTRGMKTSMANFASSTGAFAAASASSTDAFYSKTQQKENEQAS